MAATVTTLDRAIADEERIVGLPTHRPLTDGAITRRRFQIAAMSACGFLAVFAVCFASGEMQILTNTLTGFFGMYSIEKDRHLRRLGRLRGDCCASRSLSWASSCIPECSTATANCSTSAKASRGARDGASASADAIASDCARVRMLGPSGEVPIAAERELAPIRPAGGPPGGSGCPTAAAPWGCSPWPPPCWSSRWRRWPRPRRWRSPGWRWPGTWRRCAGLPWSRSASRWSPWCRRCSSPPTSCWPSSVGWAPRWRSRSWRTGGRVAGAGVAIATVLALAAVRLALPEWGRRGHRHRRLGRQHGRARGARRRPARGRRRHRGVRPRVPSGRRRAAGAHRVRRPPAVGARVRPPARAPPGRVPGGRPGRDGDRSTGAPRARDPGRPPVDRRPRLLPPQRSPSSSSWPGWPW